MRGDDLIGAEDRAAAIWSLDHAIGEAGQIQPFPRALPRYSFDTTSFSDIEASVAAIMIAATAARPKV